MKKNPFIPAALFAAALSACGDETAMTLAVVERADTDVVTDLGMAGDSIGDVLTFANKVFDETNRIEVGTDNGYCIRTAPGEAWACSWVMLFSEGQIAVWGLFYDMKDSLLAITGGTGAYQGARGEMRLHARNPAGTEFDFRFDILK